MSLSLRAYRERGGQPRGRPARWRRAGLTAALAIALAPATLAAAQAQSYTVDTGLRPPGSVPSGGRSERIYSEPAAVPHGGRSERIYSEPEVVTGSIPRAALPPADSRLPPLATDSSPASPLRPPLEVAPGAAGRGAAEPADPSRNAETPDRFRRQLVDYATSEPAGTIVIDTPNTYLYLVLGNGKAIRYGVGVGREGFTWAGRTAVSRMAEWPDWRPPNEMIERQPYLPRFMAGGPGNPMGARALYLGASIYRIHGTNEPNTIGTFVSSGCIRLVDDDVMDLYARVSVGTRVVVLPNARQSAGR
ncbi:MAG: L,D-transpeptidase [Variibacter sp.]|nr:L,D-transpeptidase [Variibacter sp.]